MSSCLNSFLVPWNISSVLQETTSSNDYRVYSPSTPPHALQLHSSTPISSQQPLRVRYITNSPSCPSTTPHPSLSKRIKRKRDGLETRNEQHTDTHAHLSIGINSTDIIIPSYTRARRLNTSLTCLCLTMILITTW
ncbi:uncharacterized protein ACWYII_009958 [Salvelinus alpinus]